MTIRSFPHTTRSRVIKLLARRPNGLSYETITNRLHTLADLGAVNSVLTTLLVEGVIGCTNKLFWLRDTIGFDQSGRGVYASPPKVGG